MNEKSSERHELVNIMHDIWAQLTAEERQEVITGPVTYVGKSPKVADTLTYIEGVLSPTGDFCDHCGSPSIVRTGTCMTCQDCGTSSGGCS